MSAEGATDDRRSGQDSEAELIAAVFIAGRSDAYHMRGGRGLAPAAPHG